jgi:hypothetical protein
MPAMRLMAIQLAQSFEWQYGMMMNLLRENIAPELQDKFDNLSNAEMQKIIVQWVDNAAW